MGDKTNNKLLHELLGEFRQFSKNMEKSLDEIKSRLEAGNETFQSIQIRCAERGVILKGYGKQLKNLENAGGSPKIRKAKDLGLVATVVYVVVQIICWILGLGPPPQLPT